MVDYTKEALLCSHSRLNKSRMSTVQQTKLESMIARSYSDDGDVQRGALSMPRSATRPGQRDDMLRCSFAGIRAVL
jgi:hypothetical protein